MNSDQVPQRIAEAANAITMIVRASTEPANRGHAGAFLRKLSDAFWPAALTAALAVALDKNGQTYRIVDEAIASALRTGAHLEIVADLYNRLPRETVALQETALEVARQTVIAMKDRGRVEIHPVGYLSILNNYVGRLLQLDRIGDAGTYAQEAVTFAEAPNHSALPGAAPQRAKAMEQMSHVLGEMDRTPEALELMQKAREIYQQLCGEGPEYKRDLAICLNSEMVLLGNLEKREEAVECGLAAAALFREFLPAERYATGHFAEEGLQEWITDVRPNLATCLITLSSTLEDASRRQEAMDAAREAVQILSPLADETPEFRPLLGQALSNQAMAFGWLENHAEELESVTAAVETFRELERFRPGAYRYFLAHTLRRQSLALARLDRIADSAQACRESVDLYRALQSVHPGAHQKELDGALEQLGLILQALGTHGEADPANT